MIDLHTHTTASDGRSSPEDLVARAAAAGVTVLAVTDHDTVAGLDAAAAACREAGIELVPGIEITAVADGLDVHVLGYFIDARSAGLAAFLAEQRSHRLTRVTQIVERLAALGISLDAAAMLESVRRDASTSIGRPWIARALVAAGHVPSSDQAFDRWLAHGRPAFVPRIGAPPAEVFRRVHEAGGVASLAHPGLLGRDAWMKGFARDGIDAIEAYHSEHDGAATRRYLDMAARLGVAVSGGSDYHGGDHGPRAPGSVSLPRAAYDELAKRAARHR